MIKFGTKAETLERLAPVLKCATVLPQVRFTAGEWHSDRSAVLARVAAAGWPDGELIVRSSGGDEDRSGSSLAGHYVSVGAVRGGAQLAEAVDKVAASLAGAAIAQIFVQPMLAGVTMSGVAFSRDPHTGADYFIINYDDTTGSTSSVTSGSSNDLKTFCHYGAAPSDPPGRLGEVICLVRELSGLLGRAALDAEFAFAAGGGLYLLQVRPLTCPEPQADPAEHMQALRDIHQKVTESTLPHPYLYGNRPLFGVMPDWNPAEMIGLRPRPLALSLYKELITDNIWAYQRDNYGYRNLRSFPLLQSFSGLPYIDVRVDFNSFVPADLDPELTGRLVNYYCERLVGSPAFHDKVEFEVVFSCYTLDIRERLSVLTSRGFSADDCERLEASLKRLTNRIISDKDGLWRKDIGKIRELEQRRHMIMDSRLSKVAKIYWLLEDCKRYGTLPFAGLARAAFIAVQILKSLVAAKVLDSRDYDSFMATLDTVGSKMARDFRGSDRADFLAKYGHLRPGTYDLLSPRYDERPELYFDWSSRERASAEKKEARFMLSLEQIKAADELLLRHGLNYTAVGLFDFIKGAIEGRETAKFIFTASLSDALSVFKELAAESGLSEEDASYADISVIKELHDTSAGIAGVLLKSAEQGRRGYPLTREINLPPLMLSPDDVWSFHLPQFSPNFVTQLEASGAVVFSNCEHDRLKGGILFIPCADPGYDWVFSHAIAGFVTMYGGVNSHMAIRAAELGIPAVIGVGEELYKRWSAAGRVRLDCLNKLVTTG